MHLIINKKQNILHITIMSEICVNKNILPTRKSYDVKFKTRVINAYYNEFSQNASETARSFRISQSLVSRWLKNEIKLKAHTGNKTKHKIVTVNRAYYPDLEDQLFTWILNRRHIFKQAINCHDVRSKTKSLIKQRDLEDQQRYKDFKISDGWVNAFMDRYHLSFREASHKTAENSKINSAKTETIINYLIDLNELAREYPPEFIIQMGETPTYIDMTENRTSEEAAAQTENKQTGHLKSRFTTILTIAANGYRLPTYVILRKLKKPPAYLELNPNIIVNVSESGFMSSELMPHYIDKVIKPYIGSSKCLIVLDDCKQYKTDKVFSYFSQNKIQPCIIPSGFTYCLQPLEVTINKPFKEELRKLWRHWNEKSVRYTKKGNKSKPTWQQTISMVDAATKTIKATKIRESFLVCGFFLSNDYNTFKRDLNSNLRKNIIDDKDWSYELKLFDSLDSQPRYNFEFKEFIQADTPNILLEYDGNEQEDDELDHELMTIESVISHSAGYANQCEINIKNTIDQVVNTIEFNNEIFSL